MPTYAQQVAAGRCPHTAQAGCTGVPVPGHRYCAPCLAAMREAYYGRAEVARTTPGPNRILCCGAWQPVQLLRTPALWLVEVPCCGRRWTMPAPTTHPPTPQEATHA